MALVPVTHQSWLFSPPLELPLQPRLENGRFDSLRPGRSRARRVRHDPGHLRRRPAEPHGRDVHFFNGLHQAVDLGSVAGTASTRPTAGAS